MEAGKQKLIFPGNGEVKLELPPNSKVLPLDKSPSGHLVARCDEFEAVPNSSATSSGAAAAPATAFTADPEDAGERPGDALLESLNRMRQTVARAGLHVVEGPAPPEPEVPTHPELDRPASAATRPSDQ